MAEEGQKERDLGLGLGLFRLNLILKAFFLYALDQFLRTDIVYDSKSGVVVTSGLTSVALALQAKPSHT